MFFVLVCVHSKDECHLRRHSQLVWVPIDGGDTVLTLELWETVCISLVDGLLGKF